MLVAICSPMFNVSKYVGAMLESCHAQTHQDCIVRLYDDGSTDLPGASDFAHIRVDDRTVIKRGPHVGFVRAFNEAFAMGLGTPAEVIARLDADDTMAPDRIAKQVALIEAGADIVTCEMNRMDEDGGNLRPRPIGGMNPDLYLAGNKSHGPIDGSLVCRAEVYWQVGLWNPAYGVGASDEWMLRALDFGFKWAHVPEFLYNYRTRLGSVIMDSHWKAHRTYVWLTEKAKEWKRLALLDRQ